MQEKTRTSAIIDLKETFAILSEQVMRQERPPTYEDLLARIKTLEEERDSLLTALRLLKEEANNRPKASNSSRDELKLPQYGKL